MKSIIAVLSLLICGSLAQAEVSEPFQINTGNYQDYREVKTPVTFIGLAKVGAQDVERFKATVNAAVPLMQAQTGNIGYSYHQSLTDKTEFTFVEEWKDGKSLADHMDSKEVGDLLSVVGSMFQSGFFKIQILEKVK